MATLIDSPEYTTNEIYRIDASDPLVAAGVNSPFGGLGIDNEPHQQLANRTAFLYGRQNTNIANIALLQALNKWTNFVVFTYTPSTQTLAIPESNLFWIFCVGGGGGGAGALNGPAYSGEPLYVSGGGGGAGGLTYGLLEGPSGGGTLLINVGAGGAGGSPGGSGASGGTTTVAASSGILALSGGGEGGTWTSGGNTSFGGIGGVATFNGQDSVLLSNGGAGGDGQAIGPFFRPGYGAPGPLGGGGRAAHGTGTNYQSGVGPGAGGGGCYGISGKGGAGANGIVIVAW